MNARALIASLFCVLLVAQIAAAPVAAAPDLNFEDDKTPNPYIEAGTVTIAEHDRSSMSSPLQYYDDNGDLQTLPAVVNDSQDTPYTFRADQIDADAYEKFPREHDNTAINASEWTTTSGASSSMSVTQTDGGTAAGVESIKFDPSVATGETASASYSNFSAITNDPKKRVLRFVGNVDSLESGAEVQLRIEDSDGDYKAAVINDSQSGSADNVIGAATGQGYVYQERLNNLATDTSNGDGAFDDIAQITVHVSGGNATVTMVGVDVESKSSFVLGETINSNDEAVDIEERYSGGDMSLSVTSLSTMGEIFDDATIRELDVSGVHYRFADLTDTDDYSVEFSDADAYSYPRKLEIYGRISVPTAIDLSHSGLSLQMHQGLISQKYANVEVAEGVGDADFDNISSWTSMTDSFSSQGATHELDSTVAVDKEYAIHAVLVLQESDEDDMTADAPSSDGGGGGFWGSGGNPVMSFFDWLIAGILAVGGSLAVWRRR